MTGGGKTKALLADLSALGGGDHPVLVVIGGDSAADALRDFIARDPALSRVQVITAEDATARGISTEPDLATKLPDLLAAELLDEVRDLASLRKDDFRRAPEGYRGKTKAGSSKRTPAWAERNQAPRSARRTRNR